MRHSTLSLALAGFAAVGHVAAAPSAHGHAHFHAKKDVAAEYVDFFCDGFDSGSLMVSGWIATWVVFDVYLHDARDGLGTGRDGDWNWTSDCALSRVIQFILVERGDVSSCNSVKSTYPVHHQMAIGRCARSRKESKFQFAVLDSC
jgi:hypothetical protein